MKQITRNEFESSVSRNTVLFGSIDRPGIMLTPDGDIVKCFYQRKRITRSALFPPAKRFAANSRELARKDIIAPMVTETLSCPEVPVDMVVYPKIEGEEIRDLCAAGDFSVLGDFAAYLAELHSKGIYFRAIHLGNVLSFKASAMALIDIADLKSHRMPLSLFARARNLAHLFERDDDKVFFRQYGIEKFLQEYFQRADLSRFTQMLLRWQLRNAIEILTITSQG